MIGFGRVLTDEEIWAIIQYEWSFAGMGMEEGWEGAGWALVRTRAAADDERQDGEPIFEL